MSQHLPLIALLRQLIVFCGVGVINTVFSLLIIFALSAGLGAHYVVANIIGYGCGLVLGFLMHRTFTFREARYHLKIHGQISRFLIVFAVSYGCQFAFLIFLVEFLAVPDLPSQVIAWLLYVPISFLGNKYFAFPHKDRLS